MPPQRSFTGSVWTPHGCYDGWVFMGLKEEDERGEEVEVYTAVRCRRCGDR